MKKRDLLSRMPDPGQKGTPFVPDWCSRLGNPDNSGFPTGTNQRFCSSGCCCTPCSCGGARCLLHALLVMSLSPRPRPASSFLSWRHHRGEPERHETVVDDWARGRSKVRMPGAGPEYAAPAASTTTPYARAPAQGCAVPMCRHATTSTTGSI